MLKNIISSLLIVKSRVKAGKKSKKAWGTQFFSSFYSKIFRLFIFLAILCYVVSLAPFSQEHSFFSKLGFQLAALGFANLAIVHIFAKLIIALYYYLNDKKLKLAANLKYILEKLGASAQDPKVTNVCVSSASCIFYFAFTLLISLVGWYVSGFLAEGTLEQAVSLSILFSYLESFFIYLSIFALNFTYLYLTIKLYGLFLEQILAKGIKNKFTKYTQQLSYLRLSLLRERFWNLQNNLFKITLFIVIVFLIAENLLLEGIISKVSLVLSFCTSYILVSLSLALAILLYVDSIALGYWFIKVMPFLSRGIDRIGSKVDEDLLSSMQLCSLPYWHYDIANLAYSKLSIKEKIVLFTDTLLLPHPFMEYSQGVVSKQFSSMLDEQGLCLVKIVSIFTAIVKNNDGEYIRFIWDFENQLWHKTSLQQDIEKIIKLNKEDIIDASLNNRVISMDPQDKYYLYQFKDNLQQWLRYTWDESEDTWSLDIRSINIPNCYLLPHIKYIADFLNEKGHILLSFNSREIQFSDVAGNIHVARLKSYIAGILYVEEKADRLWFLQNNSKK